MLSSHHSFPPTFPSSSFYVSLKEKENKIRILQDSIDMSIFTRSIRPFASRVLVSQKTPLSSRVAAPSFRFPAGNIRSFSQSPFCKKDQNSSIKKKKKKKKKEKERERERETDREERNTSIY